ncbi:hypothetical protein AB0D58_34975 [Streptomyces sp. NPDC048210]|uniref:hypothetical protein n=1 Tax=unclassified Streptomyces TaxID=2593676 RepID=UPI002E78A5E0|nr:hypothetical protein [Streptomyces sp. JV181]MEE1774845.1 hypothetical protein [Streptomyces sp. JV181]
MLMRSALTASILAADILLGGAGAALAEDDGGLIQGTGSQGAGRTSGSSLAGVIDHVGPIYTITESTEFESDRGTFRGIHF